MTTYKPNQIPELLTNLNTGDKIDVEVNSPQGVNVLVLVVDHMKKHKIDIINELHKNLVGKTITLSEASEKYNVPRGTIEGWVYRNKYLNSVGDNYPMLVHEADVAACATVYHERKKEGSKAPLFDDDGYVYELHFPGLAESRRKKKN